MKPITTKWEINGIVLQLCLFYWFGEEDDMMESQAALPISRKRWETLYTRSSIRLLSVFLLSIGLDNYMQFPESVFMNESSYQIPPKVFTKSNKDRVSRKPALCKYVVKTFIFFIWGQTKNLEVVTIPPAAKEQQNTKTFFWLAVWKLFSRVN